MHLLGCPTHFLRNVGLEIFAFVCMTFWFSLSLEVTKVVVKKTRMHSLQSLLDPSATSHSVRDSVLAQCGRLSSRRHFQSINLQPPI